MKEIFRRKADHLALCLEKPVGSTVNAGFDRYRLKHRALPELDFADVCLQTSFLGKTLRAPLIIGAITGGIPEAGRINANLALAAQHLGLGMVLGSQRIALEHPEAAESFAIARQKAPDIPLGANLGVNCLALEQCQKAIAMVDADFLVIHLNPLQEALQPQGSAHFQGILDQIGRLCEALPVPVVVKEVGNGIDAESAQLLFERGVAMVDVAGAGGTSWARVEGYRGNEAIASAFYDWGIPTTECIRACAPFGPIIASGGLKNGLDVAKSLALGARYASFAGALLAPANQGAQEVRRFLEGCLEELRIAMFCTGAKCPEDLLTRWEPVCI